MKNPKIICICGSTRFKYELKEITLSETLDGKIVLSIGCDLRSDDYFQPMSNSQKTKIKQKLDELHLRKIDLSDEVFILNVDGYIGKSTQKELDYAKKLGKRIIYLEN